MRDANENGTLNAYEICGYEMLPNDRYGYKIIAVVYDDQHWCAFRGLTDWSDEKVASQGDYIPSEVAQDLFPTLYNNIPQYWN
jgi:hypothetical protein